MIMRMTANRTHFLPEAVKNDVIIVDFLLEEGVVELVVDLLRLAAGLVLGFTLVWLKPGTGMLLSFSAVVGVNVDVVEFLVATWKKLFIVFRSVVAHC